MLTQFSIFVYADDGTSQISVQSVLSIFADKMQCVDTNIKEVRTIYAKDILAGALAQADCLIMPGGADLPYCAKLNGAGNDIIREFVANGKMYIGICAGGYYGTNEIEFTGDGYRIDGTRELSFFSGKAIGSINTFTGGRYYDEKTSTKAAVNLSFTRLNRETKSATFYYHGGAFFVENTEHHTTHRATTVATYETGEVAVVCGSFGRGKYLLSGVHFELCPKVYENIAMSDFAQLSPMLQDREKKLFNMVKNEYYGIKIYQAVKSLLAKSSQ